MSSEVDRSGQLAQAQDLRKRGELARRRDGNMARKCYEEAVELFRQLDEPLVLAHTVRHLGDVYCEEGLPHLAEPCYLEALGLYRSHRIILRSIWRTLFGASRSSDQIRASARSSHYLLPRR